jgi:outer membrane lipoprotein carrier protein
LFYKKCNYLKNIEISLEVFLKKISLAVFIAIFLINISYATEKNTTQKAKTSHVISKKKNTTKTVSKPSQPLVVERLKNIETISASFIQSTSIKNFSKEIYKGEFYLISGQKALWNYTSPYKQYYLFDSNGVEYYDSSTNQVIRQKKNSSKEANLILSVLFNFKEIEKNFDVVVNGKTQIQLKPKHDIGLKYIMILVDSKNNIKGIHSEDLEGNVTEIEFSNVEINKEINKEIFNLKLPSDAQIFNY